MRNEFEKEEQKQHVFENNKDAESTKPGNEPEEIEDVQDTFRRSIRKATTPRYLEDYAILALHAETFLADVPETFEEIASRNDKKEWMQAVNEEMSAHSKNETW